LHLLLRARHLLLRTGGDALDLTAVLLRLPRHLLALRAQVLEARDVGLDRALGHLDAGDLRPQRPEGREQRVEHLVEHVACGSAGTGPYPSAGYPTILVGPR